MIVPASERLRMEDAVPGSSMHHWTARSAQAASRIVTACDDPQAAACGGCGAAQRC